MTERHAGGFSAEQRTYLTDALSRLDLHRLFAGAARADAPPSAPPSVHGTPIDDLCREEVAKLELHPLDMMARLEAWTDADRIATGLDQFLLRHLGFFNVEPNSPGYMVRLRLPGCRMHGHQLARLADIVETRAAGYVHVTTRGNLQLREVAPRDVLNVLFALRDAGLSCHGSGADSARNITASPTAGFDPQELIDLAPLAQRLGHRILVTRELQAIPRKFNIAFDNGGTISCVGDTNDIAFQAVEVRTEGDGVEPGVYCRILLGGITGHRDFARDAGLLCRPGDAVNVAHAMMRVFVEHGDRTNRKRARLKYLLDRQGTEWFAARTDEALADIAPGAVLIRRGPEGDAPRRPVDRQAHVGVHPQREPGLNHLGLALEVGRLSAAQMRAVADVAALFGADELRLTVWQNVLIPHVADADLDAARAALSAAGIGTSATSFAAGAVACTGKAGCKFGLSFTKGDATRIVRHLEKRFELPSPINIHVTGCPNSCAQHYIGDIGLVGATMPDGAEGYHVVLGGGSDTDRGLARPLCGPVPADGVEATVEAVVGRYLAGRAGEETFLSFVRRQDDAALAGLAAALPATPPGDRAGRAMP